MSLSELLASPIQTQIGDKELQLLPLTLYDFGLLVDPYIRRKIEIVKNDYEPEEWKEKLEEIRKERYLLSDDAKPLFQWLAFDPFGTIEAILTGLGEHRGKVTKREIAAWLKSNEGGEAFSKFMRASGIFSDPTTPPDQAENPAPTEETEAA